MVISQIVHNGCVKVPLEATDKHSVISELINTLDGSRLLSNKDIALEAVLQREQIRSTGIGLGVAIPHGKCKAVNETVMAIGITGHPIDFNSFDGEPVNIVVLLLSPFGQTGQYVRALAAIIKMMLNETLRKQIQNTNDATQIWNLLRKHQNSD